MQRAKAAMGILRNITGNICVLCVLCIVPNSVLAGFDFNANCVKAYRFIFELKLNGARQLLDVEKRTNPDNAMVPLLENYVDYFYLLTSESEAEFERLEHKKADRLRQMEESDKNSPYYLYAQAEINLQWALIRGRYGEYLTAAREIRKAKSQLEENAKKFPGFLLNAKGLGLINAFLGNLPDGVLKSTLATLGIKGNLDAGAEMLEELVNSLPQSKYAAFYDETVFYYVFVLSDIARSPAAYAKTEKYTAKISDSSLLKTYLRATVCSRTAHNEEAIRILLSAPSGPEYQPFPYLHFLLGRAKLHKLDFSSSEDFNRFLRQNKGTGYIKDAHLHLAWVALLKNGRKPYLAEIENVKTKGFIYQERDKQAMNEAVEAVPDTRLLRSRLLFDGGYYQKALNELTDYKGADFAQGRDKTEYYYRLGRIRSQLGNDEQALAAYQNALALGRDLRYYFAANSALLIGKVFEEKKNKAKATAFYNAAIKMKGHDYETSIETQAKAGIRRLASSR
jgi:tetratricopeptide (TPR) repeat protein